MYKIELFGQKELSTEQNLLTTAIERYSGHLPTVMAYHLNQATLDLMNEDGRCTTPDAVVHLSSVGGSLERTIEYCEEKTVPLLIASYPNEVDSGFLDRASQTLVAVFSSNPYDTDPSHQNLKDCAEDTQDILIISLNLVDLFKRTRRSGVIQAPDLRSATSVHFERIQQKSVPQIPETCCCDNGWHGIVTKKYSSDSDQLPYK